MKNDTADELGVESTAEEAFYGRRRSTRAPDSLGRRYAHGGHKKSVVSIRLDDLAAELPNQALFDYHFAIVGPPGVGKTSLLRGECLNGTISAEDCVGPAGISFYSFLTYSLGIKVRIYLWDTNCNPDVLDATSSFCRSGVTGYVLIYDATSFDSFVQAVTLREYHMINGVICVVGNKSDILENEADSELSETEDNASPADADVSGEREARAPRSSAALGGDSDDDNRRGDGGAERDEDGEDDAQRNNDDDDSEYRREQDEEEAEREMPLLARAAIWALQQQNTRHFLTSAKRAASLKDAVKFLADPTTEELSRRNVSADSLLNMHIVPRDVLPGVLRAEYNSKLSLRRRIPGTTTRVDWL